jgi:hypothetical protein
MVDAVSPWLEHIVPMALSGPSIEKKKPEDKEEKKPQGKDEEKKPEDKGKEISEAIIKQMRVGFKVLKVFKGLTCASYVEGDALVTHSQVVLKDLPEENE